MFVDTVANINTITRDFYNIGQSKFMRGPKNEIEVKSQKLNLSGDKVRFEVDVEMNMGRIDSESEFGY